MSDPSLAPSLRALGNQANTWTDTTAIFTQTVTLFARQDHEALWIEQVPLPASKVHWGDLGLKKHDDAGEIC